VVRTAKPKAALRLGPCTQGRQTMTKGEVTSSGEETMRHARILLVITVLLVSPVRWAQGQSPPAADPSDAVFQLSVLDRQPASDGIYHSHGYGTGFFIASDGTALTAAHVVYRVAHDPEKYRLNAIVNKEFYDATVVCASKLPYDPTRGDPNKVGVQITRDVAEITLAPSTMPEGHRVFYYKTKAGERIVIAAAHLDPLPPFPFLAIGGTAQGHVRIIGFGGISPIPYKWTVNGDVVRSWASRSDGTELFDVQSPNPAVPGDSGAPVLDEHNRVVGLWAWHSYSHPDTGTAQATNALTPICR